MRRRGRGGCCARRQNHEPPVIPSVQGPCSNEASAPIWVRSIRPVCAAPATLIIVWLRSTDSPTLTPGRERRADAGHAAIGLAAIPGEAALRVGDRPQAVAFEPGAITLGIGLGAAALRIVGVARARAERRHRVEPLHELGAEVDAAPALADRWLLAEAASVVGHGVGGGEGPGPTDAALRRCFSGEGRGHDQKRALRRTQSESNGAPDRTRRLRPPSVRGKHAPPIPRAGCGGEMPAGRHVIGLKGIVAFAAHAVNGRGAVAHHMLRRCALKATATACSETDVGRANPEPCSCRIFAVFCTVQLDFGRSGRMRHGRRSSPRSWAPPFRIIHQNPACGADCSDAVLVESIS